ncbi:MAG: bifunctional oligoribonuclease/PAP phosphatase NrnA [Bacteroidales bacterium]|nr:bifunctional oligoribonuclease/PAP phosphatase NrnA [Bacteroidales bacterium]
MTQEEQTKYKQAADWIAASRKIIIVPHYNPDGDAIGSCLALHNIFLHLGKDVNSIAPNEFPEFLQWMKSTSDILLYTKDKDRADQLLDEADLVIMVDFSSKRRMDKLEDKVLGCQAKKINIDHHPEPEELADLLFSDVSVSSTAELIYRFLKQTDLLSRMDKDIASCIFTGIMTDTGCFSHNSSQPDTFKIISHLLEYGIDKDFIFASVYQDYSENRMRLLGYALSEKMTILPGLHTAYISLSMKELERYEHQLGDTEGFVNYPFSIRGIICTALFIEKEDHIKISLRSRGGFSVNALAREIYIGGGHRNAAGATAYDSLAGSITTFINQLNYHEAELKQTAIDVEKGKH